METIINNILIQLGGNHFITMVGATNLKCGSENNNTYLMLKFMKSERTKSNHLIVTYEKFKDLYKVEFVYATKTKYEIIKTYDNLYNNELKEIFEIETGLYTNL